MWNQRLPHILPKPSITSFRTPNRLLVPPITLVLHNNQDSTMFWLKVLLFMWPCPGVRSTRTVFSFFILSCLLTEDVQGLRLVSDLCMSYQSGTYVLNAIHFKYNTLLVLGLCVCVLSLDVLTPWAYSRGTWYVKG